MTINLSTVIKCLLVVFSFVLLLDMSRLFGSLEAVELAQSILKGSLYLFSIFIFSVFYIKRKAVKIDKTTYLLIGYILVCMISITWSENVKSTIVGLVSIFGTLSVGLMCARYLELEKTVKFFTMGAEIILILSLFNLFIGRDSYVLLQGVERYVGVTFGPHALARGAAVVFIYWFCRLLLKWSLVNNLTRVYGIFLLILSLSSILLADSRQVLGALGLAILFVLWRNMQRYIIVYSAVILIGFTVLLSIITIFDLQIMSVNTFVRSDIDELTTFTGRTVIWQGAFILIKEAPLLGYGFNAGGLVLEGSYSTVYGWSTQSAHNFLLHALLDVGIIGAIFLVSWYAKLCQKIIRTDDTYLISMIIFFTIVCFIERIIAGNIGFGMFYLILLSTAVFCKYPKTKRKVL